MLSFVKFALQKFPTCLYWLDDVCVFYVNGLTQPRVPLTIPHVGIDTRKLANRLADLS